MQTPFNVLRHNKWDIAPRDPVSIGATIAAAVGVTSATGVFLITAATYIGITVVTSWALNALMPKPDFGSLGSNGIMVNAREPAAPQDIVYGEVRKGGVITYYETTDTLNDIPDYPVRANEFLHQIIVLAGHPVEDIGDIYLNDEVVTLSDDAYSYTDAFGHTYAGAGWVLDEKWMESGTRPRLRVFKQDGSQTATTDTFANSSTKTLANTLLTDSNNFDGAGQPASSSFVGEGISYLYMQYIYDKDTQLWANGLPLVTAVVKGKKVEDPRTSTTAYSNNAALCIRDYIKESYGLNDTEIDDTVFSVAANVSDEDVTLDAGGTEKRYTINGIIRTDTSHQDNLQRMVTACAGTLFWGAGQWKLNVGDYIAPTKTLTLDDLRSPINLDTRTNLRDQFNIVQGTFNDAAQRWITADYPPIVGTGFITEDNGEETPLDLALPYTTSGATAQRIAKMTLYRGREQMVFSADFGLNAFDVEVGEIIELDMDRYGWTGKEFEVIGWRFGPNQDAGDLRVTLTLRETSAAAFSWDAEESDIIGNNTSLPNYQASLAINNLTASGGGKTQGDGTFVNSVILDWDDVDNAFISYYEVEWKPVADSSYSSTTTVQSDIELSPLVDGVEYIFRVRAVVNNGFKGPFSTVTFTGGGDTTAPGLPTGITAEGGYEYIAIRWTNPADADLNYVEVYENTSNTTVGATKVGISGGDEFIRANLGIDVTRWYFLKAVDYSGNASDFTAGVSATTAFIDDASFENGIYSLFTEQGLYAIEDVTSLPSSGDFDGQKVFNRTDGKLYSWNTSTSQWQQTVSEVGTIDFSDLTGTLANAQVAVNSISGTKITNGSITTNQIAARTIQAGDIATGTISANEIAAFTITGDRIAGNTITGSNIAGNTITGNKIVANTITGGLLATSGIITNSAQINDALITNAKIQNGAITTAKIGDAQITNAKIDNLAVTTAKMQDLSVDTIKVADRAITTQTSATPADFSTSNTSSFQTAASMSFTAPSSGEQVLIGASFVFTVVSNSENNANDGRYRILLNGVVFANGTLSSPENGEVSERITAISSKTTVSGTNTLTLQIRNGILTGFGSDVTASDISLFSLEALK